MAEGDGFGRGRLSGDAALAARGSIRTDQSGASRCGFSAGQHRRYRAAIGRRGATEMQRHLSLADGSRHELETHLLIAQRLRYLDGATATILLAKTAEVGRILGGLMRSMREPSDRR